MNSRGVQNPTWIENPFRLISWLEMNKFTAEHFLRTGSFLGNTTQALKMAEKRGVAFHDMTAANMVSWLGNIHKACNAICLIQSTKATARIINDIGGEYGVDTPTLRVRLEELRGLIESEMGTHLFFWVPPHRAEWYSKNAKDIVGSVCCERFKAIIPELEEAMRSYAVGRFTASAFHLMRATESAVKALGRAIGLTPAHPGWKLVFDEVWKQYQNKVPRHTSWGTHEDFFVTVSADLRAISKVWRNDIAHFVDTYTEEQARPMFEIVAAFLRDLATKLDENGTLY